MFLVVPASYHILERLFREIYRNVGYVGQKTVRHYDRFEPASFIIFSDRPLLGA